MTDVNTYTERLLACLTESFPERLLYVGLQGSYLRGEATENSDIDIMTVIDGLSSDDLCEYRRIIGRFCDGVTPCGFITGKKELSKWNPLEICHLLHSTKDIYGKLSSLVPEYSENDERNFILLSLNNLYHELCHRFIYSSRENNIAALPFAYKSAFFILQDLHYLRSGEFCRTKKELIAKLEGSDKAVLEHGEALKSAVEYDYDSSFKLIFDWCAEKTVSLNSI